MPATVAPAWARELPSAGCLCQGMAQWCARGMHKHCRCPHRSGRGAEAALRHPDGRLVIDAATKSAVNLHLVPKPCRLHQVCPCNCHRPALLEITEN